VNVTNTDLESKHTPGASVLPIENGYRLIIPAGDKNSYKLAQLGDYAKFTRKRFPAHPPRTLSLRARASAASIPGTWGFGLWNDPFGLSIGYGGKPFHLPTLPNAIWFFHASKENYLSFGDPSIPSRGQAGSGRAKPGNGFLAQAFRSPTLPLGRLAKVGATFPFSRTKARALMSEIVEEDGVRLEVDVTEWHGYRFEWSPERSAFWVDDALVLETSVVPRFPLGLVIWIDNQYAAWWPDGKLGFGILGNDEAWLEVKEIEVKRP
jgi:hypothetical protein